MRVIIACESSGTVRSAFRALGHDAWSCDLLPADDGHPCHLQKDAVEAIKGGLEGEPWDLVIAHPPCTHIAVSGARHFAAKRTDGRQQAGIALFLAIRDACEAIGAAYAIENPVCIMSTLYRKPDQIIQPHQFGHPEFKATCYWLTGLPKLIPTNPLPIPERGTPEWRAWERKHRLGPSPDRAEKRSESFANVSEAMADQWGRIAARSAA